jgi:chorismate mutase
VDIDDWRKKIDEVDAELIRLLNRRCAYAVEIGKLKRQLNLALITPEREEGVIANVLQHNQGPLDEAAIRRLFTRILEESRRIQMTNTEIEESV